MVNVTFTSSITTCASPSTITVLTTFATSVGGGDWHVTSAAAVITKTTKYHGILIFFLCLN